MMSSPAKAVLLMLSVLPWLLQASPLNSCEAQSKCLSITYNTKTGGPCADCEYYVCITIDSSKPGCPKNGGLISHSCLPNRTGCDSDPTDYYDFRGSYYPEDFKSVTRCFDVKPGDLLHFIIKDGNTCYPGCSTDAENALLVGSPAGSSIQCAGTNDWCHSCSGDGNIGKECIWSLKLPAPAQCGAAALGDRVWVDSNGNGVQDAGEVGLPGVTVNLLKGDGSPTGTSTTTDANGIYGFTGLAPGSYVVQFITPAGYKLSPTGQGTTATDSNAGANGKTNIISLAAGQTDNTIDCGMVPTSPSPAASQSPAQPLPSPAASPLTSPVATAAPSPVVLPSPLPSPSPEGFGGEGFCTCPNNLRSPECLAVDAQNPGYLKVDIPGCDFEKLLTTLQSLGYGCVRPVNSCDTVVCDKFVPPEVYNSACVPVILPLF